MPPFRALAKNMAPMTNADESPTNRLTLFPIYLSLFVVSTLCLLSTSCCKRCERILMPACCNQSLRVFDGVYVKFTTLKRNRPVLFQIDF